MLPLKDNNISVKEYNKISKYKQKLIKMWLFKTTTKLVIIVTQGMSKKDINT